jgi:GT2 family glycosyltransferase
MSASLAIVMPVAPSDFAWRQLLPLLAAANAEEMVLVFVEGDQLETSSTSASVVYSKQGRAQQMNAGAAATKADWLWFLHIDSQPQEKTFLALHAFIAKNQDAIGFFDLVFQNDGPGLMWLNRFGANWRSHWLGLPFGDQGFIMPRRVFERIGGFDTSIESGEDHALVWAARKRGIEIQGLHAPLMTSARKYSKLGWWATTRMHLVQTYRQAKLFSRGGAG